MKGVIEIDHGWKRIERELKRMDASYVKVGLLSGAGSYAGGGRANLVDIGTFNEFGTKTIPERPFMRQSFEKNIAAIRKRFDSLVGEIYVGRTDTEGALHEIGERHKGEIQGEIVSGGWTPNAPSTIRKKGSSKPLIDTGAMRQAINYEVEVKG